MAITKRAENYPQWYLDIVQQAGLGGRAAALLGERGARGLDRVLVELAHQLADELHLAPPAFEVADAPHFREGVQQLLGQRQLRERVGPQRQQVLAERLQRVALLLQVGPARRAVGVGALQFALEFDVQLAAFGDEMAADVVAFFGFA